MEQHPTTAIIGILRQHFEEFGSLWAQRQAALRSPDFRAGDLVGMASRIEAHLDGLVIGGDATVPIAKEALTGDDPQAVFAAAYTLLYLKTAAAADLVMESLLEAKPKRFDGLRQALCHGPIDLSKSGCGRPRRPAAHVAAVTVEALLNHGRQSVEVQRLAEFIRDKDPAVRRAAWRTVALL